MSKKTQVIIKGVITLVWKLQYVKVRIVLRFYHAEGFTMKTNWKGKGPADESEDQKRESFS